MSKYAWQVANICDECEGGFMSYQTESLCPSCITKQNLKIWEYQLSAGYHGMSDFILIEASTEEEADKIFKKKFPKKFKYVFHVKIFEHKEWMQPLNKMEVIR